MGDPNLLYFGFLASLDSQTYLDQVRVAISDVTSPVNQHRDYAEQIIINSAITTRKFLIFTVAVWLLLAALVTPIGALVLKWGVHD